MTGAEFVARLPSMEPLFGAELAQHREALGLTQAQLAKILGVSTRTLQTIEGTEKPVMGKSILIAIAIQWLRVQKSIHSG